MKHLPQRLTVLPTVVLGLLALGLSSPAAAQVESPGKRIEDQMAALCASCSASAQLTSRLAEMRKLSMPTSILQRKLEEGVAKKVPPERIARVLTAMADDLIWLEGNIGCSQMRDKESRNLVLTTGSDLITSGIGKTRYLKILNNLCLQSNFEKQFIRYAELHFFLTNRYRVDQQASWSFVLALSQKQRSQGALNRLVAVLDEIHRTRGSISKPLQAATAKLEQGGSLRATGNALREQFHIR